MSSKTIYLKDYKAPEFLIPKTELWVELDEEFTLVKSRLEIEANPESPLLESIQLDGENLDLIQLAIDGEQLEESRYTLTGDRLQIDGVPQKFVLETSAKIYPQSNTSLSGLYKSGGMFCTQCEAEGFRRITWYLDRPDVLSEFTTSVIGNPQRYPVLLSNGNPVSDRLLDDGRREVVWHDPFPKPSYLFALVAGTLSVIEDSFRTMTGRDIKIQVYVEAKDLDKCDHAIESLKRSMRWDEDVYGREYDLDIFMIVAVDDFNMGAMENKGLNIFNTSAVLANPKTTTDQRFQWVEGVVAHEYFHNWSGNRVTCRDWFQLSLKEGFTVYRDNEFSGDMNSAAVNRIENVKTVKTYQFSEDAGPLAHPVQPSSYMEINNFYTLTVYEKGAEVVRMIAALLGPEKFRQGTDLYFDRHDGQAVTIEDFVAAMADVSGLDFTQFMNWYRQAGTPELDISGIYDENQNRFRLIAKQYCPPTPEAQVKKPFLVPIKMGLVGSSGPISLHSEQLGLNGESETVIQFTRPSQEFCFENVTERPVPSLLRDFSAPVRLSYDFSADDLARLVTHDVNPYVRWDSVQKLAFNELEALQDAIVNGKLPVAGQSLQALFRQLLEGEIEDPALLALMLILPSEDSMAEEVSIVDVDAIHLSRERLRSDLGTGLSGLFADTYRRFVCVEPYQPTADQIARRSLKNTALNYWILSGDDKAVTACIDQFDNATNMTDQLSALSALANYPAARESADRALADFYEQWKGEALVVNQWFAIQACSASRGTVENVLKLMGHSAFEITNPNKVRSVVGAFASQNAINFHKVDGTGYRFLVDQIIRLNQINPQIGSRMTVPLTKWKRYSEERAELMKAELNRIREIPELSPDIEELVTKSLV